MRWFRFATGGTGYVFDQGVADVSAAPFGHVTNTSSTLYATEERSPDLLQLPADYVVIIFPDTTTGTFTIDTTASGYPFRCDKEGVAYSADNGGIATLRERTSGNLLRLDNGEIRVKRLADNSVSWP
jgi:hypothetical protein